MTTPAPACLLWDFGDTIADQGWMRVAPPQVPEWASRYGRVVDHLGDAWDRGDVTMAELVEAVAEELGLPPAFVRQHAEDRCRAIEFYPGVMTSVRLRRVPQALVTVNPDGFSDLIVPYYELDQLFDLIVISHQEHTTDKATLCTIALERLGLEVGAGRSLLIDNVEANVRAWERLGEQAYWFRGPSRFEQDLLAGTLPGVLVPRAAKQQTKRKQRVSGSARNSQPPSW